MIPLYDVCSILSGMRYAWAAVACYPKSYVDEGVTVKVSMFSLRYFYSAMEYRTKETDIQ